MAVLAGYILAKNVSEIAMFPFQIWGLFGKLIHHIPLIVRWPGAAKAGAVSDSLFYNVDLGPTLCDLLDMPVPEDWDGASFKANLAGEEGLDRQLWLSLRAYRALRHSRGPVSDEQYPGCAPADRGAVQHGYGGLDPGAVDEGTYDPRSAGGDSARAGQSD